MMEDFDFDQHFADKMRQAGAPDFGEADWERLTPRLDAQQRQRWRVLPLWWLGALSGLLLCSNLGWWWMWQQTEKRTDALQTVWQQTQQAAVIKRDTTWQKVVVYQYDTVYRTEVYRTPAFTAANSGLVANTFTRATNNMEENIFGENKSAANNIPSNEKPTGSAIPTPNENANTAVESLASSSTADQNVLLPAQQSDVCAMLPTFMPPIQIPLRHIKKPSNDLVFTPLKREPREPLLVPRAFRLGGGGGFAVPKADHFFRRGGFTTSINGEVVFSEQLALTLEGSHSGIKFESAQYNESIGLPPLPPLGDDYIFKHVETHEGFKPIYQFSTGMRYWVRANHTFSPYLGMGYAAQWHPAYEINVEFTHRITGKEESVSVAVPALKTPVSLLDINAGARLRLSPHWRWQTGANYQVKLDRKQPGIPQFWGLKTIFLYGF